MYPYNTVLLQKGGPSDDGGEFRPPPTEVGVPFAKYKMARHNEARLMGYLIRDPVLRYTDIEKTNLVRASIQIRTLRGSREFGTDRRKGYDEHIIFSQQEKYMTFMAQLKKYDIVQVKGNIITLSSRFTATCPECQNAQILKDEVAVINPIFIDRVDASKEIAHDRDGVNLTFEEKIERFLRKRIEVSNNIALIGDCVKPPENFEGIVSYGLEVIRKYKIREDDVSRKKDYPYIKCYGKIAENDFKFIRKGSRVFIDGFIMSRNFNRVFTCPNCGTEFPVARSRSEVVPYSVEYLSNCNTGYEEVNNDVNLGLSEEEEENEQ